MRSKTNQGREVMLAEAAKRFKRGGISALEDSELSALRNFADGVLSHRAQGRTEMLTKLLRAEEKTALSLWDVKAIDLPPGETIVVTRYHWDGENRHSMEVSVRVRGYRQAKGVPRGIGLAKEHPGAVALFLFLAYWEQPGRINLTERQALDLTRETFPGVPGFDRVGRWRRAKRLLCAAADGDVNDPLFEVLSPILSERWSSARVVKSLREASETLDLDAPQRKQFKVAVEEIAKRAVPMLKERGA